MNDFSITGLEKRKRIRKMRTKAVVVLISSTSLLVAVYLLKTERVKSFTLNTDSSYRSPYIFNKPVGRISLCEDNFVIVINYVILIVRVADLVLIFGEE